MKLKKIVARVLVGALILTALPMAKWSGGEVKAQAPTGTATDENNKTYSYWDTVDQNGNSCKVICLKGNVDRNEIVHAQSQGREISALFDNVTDRSNNGVIFDIGGDAGDAEYINNGDYIGVMYPTEYQVNGISFTWWDAANPRFAAAQVQCHINGVWSDMYQEDGTLCEYDLGNSQSGVSQHTFAYTFQEAVVADGIRILCTEDEGNTGYHAANPWLRMTEFAVNYEELPELTVTAGTEQSGEEASNVLDENDDTMWHAAYNNTDASKLWLDFNYRTETVVEGISVLQRENIQDGNGYITGYEVWVSNSDTVDETNWQASYTKVCEGTWNRDDSAKSWRSAQFEAVTAKRVRLFATNTYEDPTNTDKAYAALYEVQLQTLESLPETSPYTTFKGGSLRMNDFGEDYTQTSMRFGYDIPKTVDDLTVQSWKWMWGKTDSSLTTEVSGTYRITSPDMDNAYRSNLVITGIPKEGGFATDVYAQLIITYANEEGETLTIYTNVENRSVNTVATSIRNNYANDKANAAGDAEELEKIEKAYVYAGGILGV